MARLEVVVSEASTPSVVFQRVAEGESLKEVAKSWQVPVGRFTEWFSNEHAELYDAALKVRADQLAHEALEISDEQQAVEKKDGSEFDPDVPRDKLRVDTRLKLASKWDRARYGETVKIDRMITVSADAGLIGLAGELLARITARPEKVIEHVPAPEDDTELI